MARAADKNWSGLDQAEGGALAAWTGLLGHLSYELFGHLRNGVTDYDAFFEHQLVRSTAVLIAGGPPV